MTSRIFRLIGTSLVVCFGATLCRAEDRPGCDATADILVIYECESGLVLWSRKDATDRAPVLLSTTALCRLVRPADPRRNDQESCL